METPKSTSDQPQELTGLLQRMRHGDQSAAEKAVELVYGELRRIASRELRHERPGHLLQTTALINEAYVRLAQSDSLDIQSRTHFFAIASRQMRRVLVDYARRCNAQRRGAGSICIGLDGVQTGCNPRGADLLMLDRALGDLQGVDERAARVVELRYFGGYTDNEVVAALGVSLTTVRRDWEFARSWLYARMQPRPASPAPGSKAP